MKNGVFILILFLSGLTGKAQLISQPVIIGSKLHTGLILPFYEALEYLVQDDIYAIDLSVNFPSYGKDYWEQLYRYPRPGVGFSCWSLGNNEVLGKAYSLYSFINIPFFVRREKFSFNYQISFGGAYLSKKFDVHENHLNRAIGSHANVYIRLGIDSKIKLSPRSELVIEAGTTHFSNGKTSSPNYGINAATLSLGYNYLIGDSHIPYQEQSIPEIGKRYVQTLLFSGGSKVYDNLSGEKYFFSSVSYNIERIINHKRKIGLGTDFSYDGSIREALASAEGVRENDFAKLIRLGLHASYGIQYKRILMRIQIGHYLYSKYIVLTPVYSRISVQYLITKNLLGSIGIKSHLGKADCLEYGIGYYW